jgi:protein TonB
MFGEFVEARAGEAGRKRWAIAVSILVQAGALATLLLMPLLYTEALPNILGSMKALVVRPMPLVDTPKPPEIREPQVRRPQRFFDGNVFRMPSFIPPTVAMIKEPPLPPALSGDATGLGLPGVDPFGSSLGEPAASASEAEPPPVVPPTIQRIRQTEIEPAMVLSRPQPAYPVFALRNRVQGEVVLHAIIDRQGRVAELEVVSGHPMLVKVALDAVETWRYRPTLLNGEAVEVETTITVKFVLDDRR